MGRYRFRTNPRRAATGIAVLLVALAAGLLQYVNRNHNNPPDGARTSAPAPDIRPDPGPGFRTRQALEEHFRKHGNEFGQPITIDDYLRRAQALRDAPAPAGGTILQLKRPDGVICRFDRATGDFVAVNRDRTIRTFFRPNDGESYFRRQAHRTQD
jgi:hypothetical protein